MRRERDLTSGGITKTLVLLALPIMGTSLINMLYNLTDIMWLGRFSTKAVAAAGAVGFFMWFGSGIIMISQIGVGIGVSQSYGKNDQKELAAYISNALKLDMILAIFYAVFLFLFRYKLVGFFNLQDPEVFYMAISYLEIICLGIIFHFLNPVISAIFNATGNSLTPFIINSIGLVANMILDPVLIFGIGPIPAFGIRGAAIATSLSQFTVTMFFVLAIIKNRELFTDVKIFSKPDMKYIKKISKLGLPAFFQTSMHSGINMIIAKFLASWGATAIAVQATGSQIESISWMTAEGFSSAITAFIGQNYGAKNYERVERGYIQGLKIVSLIGLFSGLLFIFAGESVFSIFIPDDPIAIIQGGSYLRILGYSQIFLCIEIASMGAFNGIGEPRIPAIIGIIFNATRIPMALVLSATGLGLDGIWWSISISTMFKGIISTTLGVKRLKTKLSLE